MSAVEDDIVPEDIPTEVMSKDMTLHPDDQRLEVMSKKARELLTGYAALETTLREHKDLLNSLVSASEASTKTRVSRDEPAFNLPGAVEDGVRPTSKEGHDKHTIAWGQTASDQSSSKQSKKKKHSAEGPSELSAVVPTTPQADTGKEDSDLQTAGAKLVHRATYIAETFKSDMNQVQTDDEESAESEGAGYRWKVRRILAHPAFDITIGGFIVLNAIMLGIQSDWSVQNITGQVSTAWNAQNITGQVPDGWTLETINAEEPEAFSVIEKIFAVIFASELALRLFGKGFVGFYCGPEWKWALFDSTIVGLQMIEEISTLAVGSQAAQGGNLGFMRVMRILRLLRIMRLVRLLQFVSELRTMVMSIVGSMKSLVWTILLMLLIKYIIGVCLCQLIADRGLENPGAMTQDLVEFYGSLPRAVLSLYQAMTGGVDWNDLSKPLEESISPMMTVGFALYVAFAVLAMMNVVTGVFVESALGSAREDREKEVISSVKKIFQVADHDQSGVLTWGEFSKTLEEPSNLKYFGSLGINASEARGLFGLLDADESGSVSLQEFMQGCLRLRGQAKAIDMATLMYQNKRIVFWLADRLERLEGSLRPMENDGKVVPYKKNDSMTKVGPVVKTWMELTNEHKSGRRRGSSK
mmetsp:Transcript_4891/g.11573  ORF Transcript_4891/g.11573 Transcript_4891/m.11573 type:complete len:640 (-) Transcript_4891:130-2049(-)|eukprot:s2215_g7.t1